MSQSKFLNNSKFNLIILTVSLIAAAIVLIVGLLGTKYKAEFDPQKLTLPYNSNGNYYVQTYVKLKNSGKLKRIFYGSPSTESFQSKVVIHDFDEQIPHQQFNYDSTSFFPQSVGYFDYNGDGNEEMLIFYQRDNSILLSIIDLFNKAELLRDILIETRPDNARKENWDTYVYPIGVDNQNTPRYFYFYISTGYAVFPRSAYKLDLKSLKVVNKFETASPFGKGFIIDLDGDGKMEIAIRNHAAFNTYNIKPQPRFHDNTDRIFILDDDLNLINHYEADTSKAISVFELLKTGNKFNLLFGEIERKETQTLTLNIMDENGEIYSSNIFNNAINQSNWYAFYSKDNFANLTLNDGIVSINDSLIIRDKYDLSIQLSQAFLQFYLEEDRLSIGMLNKHLYFFDQDLNLIDNLIFDKNPNHVRGAVSAVEKDGVIYWIFNFFDRMVYGRILAKTFWDYTRIPLLILFGFPFLLIGGRTLYNRTNIYQKYLISTFNREDAYLIVTNQNLKVLSINQNAREFFKCEKHDLLERSINSFPSILSKLNECLKNGTKSRDEITLTKDGEEYRMLLQIDVFKDIFGSVMGTFIQIEDFTKSILKERSQVWSHAILKVAHEIKTPLSSINLNLKYIQNTLKKDDKLNPLLESDFSLIKNEVDRI